MQNLSLSDSTLIETCAKLFAENVGPEFGQHDLDFSVESLETVDACLERAALVWANSPLEEKRHLVRLASAYIGRTITQNDDQASLTIENGHFLLTILSNHGQHTTYIDNKVEKKLIDPENKSVVSFVFGFYALAGTL